MSKGPGAVEARIAELLAATRDRGLSVAELADHAFGLNGRPATRAQRLSATRAGHRLIRRIKEAARKASAFYAAARLEADAAVGQRPTPPNFQGLSPVMPPLRPLAKPTSPPTPPRTPPSRRPNPGQRGEKLCVLRRAVRNMGAIHSRG